MLLYECCVDAEWCCHGFDLLGGSTIVLEGRSGQVSTREDLDVDITYKSALEGGLLPTEGKRRWTKSLLELAPSEEETSQPRLEDTLSHWRLVHCIMHASAGNSRTLPRQWSDTVQLTRSKCQHMRDISFSFRSTYQSSRPSMRSWNLVLSAGRYQCYTRTDDQRVHSQIMRDVKQMDTSIRTEARRRPTEDNCTRMLRRWD